MTLTTNMHGMDYNGTRKTFCIEASQIVEPCDDPDTFVLKSHKTGAEKTFVYSHSDFRDGEVVGSWYKCGDMSLLIIND